MFLAGEQGQVFGGSVVGRLVAAHPGAFTGRLDPAKGLEKVHDALAYWFPAQHAAAYPEEAAKRAGRETNDDAMAKLKAKAQAQR